MINHFYFSFTKSEVVLFMDDDWLQALRPSRYRVPFLCRTSRLFESFVGAYRATIAIIGKKSGGAQQVAADDVDFHATEINCNASCTPQLPPYALH